MLAFCLVGLAIGAPPGALMALLPKAVASERLATTLGVNGRRARVMAVAQLAAGAVRAWQPAPARRSSSPRWSWRRRRRLRVFRLVDQSSRR
jgi:hypothetical protein